MNEQDDDLYGDLEVNIKAPSTNTHQINIQQERQEIINLKKELAKVKKENEILKRNIGTLYRTAANEIKRLSGNS
jgi:transposase-like protein